MEVRGGKQNKIQSFLVTKDSLKQRIKLLQKLTSSEEFIKM